MSTSLSVILRRFAMIFAVVGVLFGIMLLFSYDIIKIDWPSFMEIQPSYRPMENPLPVPARSIPIEGPIAIPGMLPPENLVEADEASITRGAELYTLHCQMCHGQTAQGNGPSLLSCKQAPPHSPVVRRKGWFDLPYRTNGVAGRCRAQQDLTV
jgi:hypothetical protein